MKWKQKFSCMKERTKILYKILFFFQNKQARKQADRLKWILVLVL
jgi:uncharacterized Rmd1/YagE family protein